MERAESRILGLPEALGFFGASKEECRLAEEFVAGQAEETVLNGIKARDLSAATEAAEEKWKEVFKALRKQRKKEAEGRLFTLLFAFGAESCYPLVPEEIINGERSLPGIASEKRAAVYAAAIGAKSYSIDAHRLKCLLEIVEKDPELLKKALGCGRGWTANGRVILLALYFLEKYGSRVNAGESGAGMVAAEDLAMLREYEEIVAGSFYVAHVLAAIEKGRKARAVGGIEVPLAADAAAGNGAASRHAIAANTKALPPQHRFATSDLEHLLYLTAGMAYLNFRLSDGLKELVREALAVDAACMLRIFLEVGQGLTADIRMQGGAFDREFGLDRKAYIYWAARKGLTEILEVQFFNNRGDYLEVLKRVESEYLQAQIENDHRSWRVVDNAREAQNADEAIFEALKKHDPALYEDILAKRRDDGGKREMDQLIAAVVPDFEDAGVIKAYLYGQEKAEALYPCVERLRGQRDAGDMDNLLKKYLERYPNEDFLRRCQVLMLLWQSNYSAFFLNSYIMQGDWEDWKIPPELVGKLFRNFAQEGIGISWQLDGVICLYDLCNQMLFYGDKREEFLAGAQESFSVYLKERRQETLAAFAQAGAFGRFFGLRVMRRSAQENKAEILKYSQDTAKIVKQELLDILCGEKGWESEVKALLSSKKAIERELAARVLFAWQQAGADYGELLREAAGKEKNAKVKELLGNAAELAAGGVPGAGAAGAFSREALVASIHQGNQKRRLAWAYETPFSEVHFKVAQAAGGAAVASEEYLQAILLCYAAMSAKRTGISKNAAFLAEALDAREFSVYVNELFDKWLLAGAESKKRWVLYAAAIHGGAAVVEKLQQQIKEWPQCARGAIACEAVYALSLNPSPQALLAVDKIARNFRFQQVRAAANEALSFAAEQLGISRMELEDRIVPDFGFNEYGERYFDYGSRAFLAALTPEMELAVFELEGAPGKAARRGKKLKTLPAPGKRDDAGKAAAAYEEFRQLKKQLRATVSVQKQRMEYALWSAREWSGDAWMQLFVKNPVMHSFATGLVWGVYENGELAQSFRYMGDGSFQTVDEEEYGLPENSRIALVHPLDLTETKNMAWQQLLAEYEITPPLEQLTRTMYRVTQTETGQKELARFGDWIVNDISLSSELTRLGWYRGPVEDAGFFHTWYREEADMGIGVELDFSGSYVEGEDEDVMVYCARFYQVEKDKKTEHGYGRRDEEQFYALQEVPKRYFSEIVRQLVKALGMKG